MTHKDLEGKVAVITGGSEGIGFGIASALAYRGSLVYLIARTKSKLEAAKQEIEKNGGKAEIKPADITDIEAVKSIIDNIHEQNGRLDIFVNNAGRWKLQTIGEDINELRNMRQLTDKAPSEITEYLTHKFRSSETELKILNVISQAGLYYLPGNLGYGKGKKSLAITILELQGEMDHHEIKNIKLYSIYPATVATPNVMPAIKSGELKDATTLESVIETAIDLLDDKTPTRHAYIGYIPGKGITRKYLEVNPKTFQMFPQTGNDEIINPNFTPEDLLK